MIYHENIQQKEANNSYINDRQNYLKSENISRDKRYYFKRIKFPFIRKI